MIYYERAIRDGVSADVVKNDKYIWKLAENNTKLKKMLKKNKY